jgi:hypothetical protein
MRTLKLWFKVGRNPQLLRLPTIVHDPSKLYHPFYIAHRYKRPAEPKPAKPEFVTYLAQAVPTEQKEPLRLSTRVFPVLSSNLYSDYLPRIAVREVLQNAWDAIANRPDGHIHITIDAQAQSVSIQDNGAGMTPEEVREFMLTLGGSGKAEGGMAGGFGIGKVAVFMGGDSFTIETVALKEGKKIKTTVTGNKNELMETGQVTVHEEETDPTTPTGTRVTLNFSKFDDFGRAVKFITEMKMYQVKELPFKVTIDELNFPQPFSRFIRPSEAEFFKFKPRYIGEHQEGRHTKWDYYETEEKHDRRESIISVVYLNNGLFQGMDSIYLPEGVHGIPYRVFVDVQTTVPPEDPEYPWRADREALKPELKGKIVEWALDRYYRGAKLKETEQYETALREAEPLAAGVKFIWGKAKDDEYLRQIVPMVLKDPEFLKATEIIAKFTRRLFERLYPDDPVPDIYFTFDKRFYGRYNIYKDQTTLFLNPLLLFRLAVSKASKFYHLKPPKKSYETFVAEHWAGQFLATIAHEITHHAVRAHDEEFAGELTELTGLMDAMGWKTNSLAWVSKRLEKMVNAMSTLSRYLEGYEELFQVEGLKGSD